MATRITRYDAIQATQKGARDLEIILVVTAGQGGGKQQSSLSNEAYAEGFQQESHGLMGFVGSSKLTSNVKVVRYCRSRDIANYVAVFMGLL